MVYLCTGVEHRTFGKSLTFQHWQTLNACGLERLYWPAWYGSRNHILVLTNILAAIPQSYNGPACIDTRFLYLTFFFSEMIRERYGRCIGIQYMHRKDTHLGGRENTCLHCKDTHFPCQSQQNIWCTAASILLYNDSSFGPQQTQVARSGTLAT